jgi:hypothetical protein
MKLRRLASSSVALLISVAALRAAGGQAVPAPRSTASTKTWTSFRTQDGRPDLQGVWLNVFATPVERPEALQGKASLTDDEVAELKRRADRLFKETTSNSDFALGDSLFLAALANPDRYVSANGPGRVADLMLPREFDHRTSW